MALRVRHPYALADDAPPLDGSVHYAPRRSADVDPETGIFELPNDKRGWLDRWAARYGYDGSDLLVSDTGGDSTQGSTDATDGSDAADAAGTCRATTASGDPCGNAAGDDGYCHLASHGPEDDGE